MTVETSPVPADGWCRDTTPFWQHIDPGSHWAGRMEPPYRYGYPARLPGGDVLELPIRRLRADPSQAVASLIANQASLAVVARLTDEMAVLARDFRPEVLVGLPTLGMSFAPGMAARLGHRRYVPLGYSRKFWYDQALSVPVSSLTTPQPGKRVYLDPNQRSLVQGVRVAIVDDAVSSGGTARAVWDLLEQLGARVQGLVVAMRQGQGWRDALGEQRAQRVLGVFDSPRLQLGPDGWWPRPR